MIKEIYQKSKSFLPLKIEAIDWDETQLNLRGKGWGFNTLSCWRIVCNNQFLCGSYDEKDNEFLMNCLNESIISIQPQTSELAIDPVLVFSNGYILEVFSTTFFEPWTFYIPGGPIYVASPGDARDII